MSKEKESKVEISKIVVEVEGEKISLTPEGAKKLQKLLNDLFGKEVIVTEKVIEHHHHDHWPYRYFWNQPVWTTALPAKTPDWTVYSSSLGEKLGEFKLQNESLMLSVK